VLHKKWNIEEMWLGLGLQSSKLSVLAKTVLNYYLFLGTLMVFASLKTSFWFRPRKERKRKCPSSWQPGRSLSWDPGSTKTSERERWRQWRQNV